MNQTINLIQWKNHTPEVKDEHDFKNYKYDYQCEHGTGWQYLDEDDVFEDCVYRLVIEKDKWYYTEDYEGFQCQKLGSEINPEDYTMLRPAKPSEIPKPESLEDRIKAKYSGYEVAMCKPVTWHDVYFVGFKRGEKSWSTFEAQGMKGFQGYVYECEDGLKENVLPVICNGNKYIQPKAVLFEVKG
tara:strand:+ start:301 stop:858 length:558 start_codon:yes stop_codon:yes gene_type:complete